MTRVLVKNLSDTNKDNIIINGNFDIWQRGTVLTTATNGFFLADRWRTLKTGGNVTSLSQQQDRPTAVESGFQSKFSMRYDIDNTSTGVDGILYPIEGSKATQEKVLSTPKKL